MDENPYEAPKVPSDRESKPSTTPARFAVLLVVGAIIAFLLVQLWAATAPWSPF
jgi:hypothetical protein